MNPADHFDNTTGPYPFGVDPVSHHLLALPVNLFNLNVDILVYLKFCLSLYYLFLSFLKSKCALCMLTLHLSLL